MPRIPRQAGPTFGFGQVFGSQNDLVFFGQLSHHANAEDSSRNRDIFRFGQISCQIELLFGFWPSRSPFWVWPGFLKANLGLPATSMPRIPRQAGPTFGFGQVFGSQSDLVFFGQFSHHANVEDSSRNKDIFRFGQISC